LDVGVEDLAPGDEGITYPDGRVILSESTYRGMVAGNPRDRFTTIHEGYHGIQHAHQLQHRLVHSKLVLHRRQSIPTFRDPEWQANAFASVTLMPTEMVCEVIRPVKECYRPIIVQKTFCVSAQSAAYRLKHLAERGKI
jgi:Zn-dependent peptidase ImmA (M78 family)